MVQIANNHPVGIILSEYSDRDGFRRRDITRHRRQRASLRFIAFINPSQGSKKKKQQKQKNKKNKKKTKRRI
jgi:hypothetical protein